MSIRIPANYLEIIQSHSSQKEALVIDGTSYTYGQLKTLAIELATKWGVAESKRIRVIKEPDILAQLISFLACYQTNEIPLIVPYDTKEFTNQQHLSEVIIPENACMAVTTSGTTGTPKIYFRSFQSWAGYFPIQNQIFQVTSDSRLFVQGSLAFTGNLNLYLAQFYAGGTIIAENAFLPKQWEERISSQRADSIYLIPSKLMLLPHLVREKNPSIKMVISGSQSLGKEDADRLKRIFPNTRIVLYYGASELNYITYVTDENMTSERNLIGRPFPEVDVFIQNQEIYVNTEYHVEGIRCPYSLSDSGYMDEEGNLYFTGRRDDILAVHGRKVSALKIENELESFPEIQEAAVVLEPAKEMQNLNQKAGNYIIAYIVSAPGYSFQESEIIQKLRKVLASYEMPRRIRSIDYMPKNESGKVDKKRLNVLQ